MSPASAFKPADALSDPESRLFGRQPSATKLSDDGRLARPSSFLPDFGRVYRAGTPGRRSPNAMPPPVSRLGKQPAVVAAALDRTGVSFALIGGLALASQKVVRATQDVDLLVPAGSADAIDAGPVRLGYRCLNRCADAANYARGDERVDFIFARRPIASRLLEGATGLETALGRLRVVSAEGLVGFKLQA